MTITLAEVVFGLIAIVAAIVLLVIGAIERESSSPYEFHYFQPWHSDAAFTFIGGNYTSSDVMVTDVFQVHRANWSVRLTAYKVHWLGGWCLTVDIYQEGGTRPLRTIRGDMVASFSRDAWIEWTILGETYGRAEPNVYYPDLPMGNYYLKVASKKNTWMIDIVEAEKILVSGTSKVW
jgi:hypothetical protein